MTLEEIKERYSSMNEFKRGFIMLLIGLIYPGYLFYERGLSLQQELQDAQRQKTVVENQYEVAKKKSSELPLLEEKFSKQQGLLRKAQEKLPNKFYMDDVLHSIASLAKESGATIKSFVPMQEVLKAGEFSYAELPISLNMSGTFNQIAGFFDKIVNLEKVVHMRDISISATRAQESGNAMLSVTLQVIVFRSS
ncbi:MAG: type 4a pilus biogenesis protein PilO [Pseudomonadota bacterium]|nr:type 4a pilus biogenesis protein PilO [Pseudomonadota bacterium]